MIKRRKIRKKSGRGREQSGDENFPPELKVTILHEAIIVNFPGQNNQLTGLNITESDIETSDIINLRSLRKG